MARQRSRPDAPPWVGRSGSSGRPFLPASAGRSIAPTSPLTLAPAVNLALALLLATVSAPAQAGVTTVSPRTGAPGMFEPLTGSLLVNYYETFLRDQDIEPFRRLVSTRYTEGTLCRLIEAGDTQARRAAVLALGLFGTIESNTSVARALRDGDLTVRRLATDALWAIWFRADTAENNQTLEQVSNLISRQRLDEAADLATRLIERAPRFAEAYNQRAIAHFNRGQFEQSAADCRRTLELNPYHFGALGGLAQCQLNLRQPREALKTLRRALKLQPFSEGLRNIVAQVESESE